MFDINKVKYYSDMVDLIEFYTHLEAMAVFAALDIRVRENSLQGDRDYVVINDHELIKILESEFFEIYDHYKSNPGNEIKDLDWNKIEILSDKKRLWYRVGGYMAQMIDEKLGREKLTELIKMKPEEFINTYVNIRDK